MPKVQKKKEVRVQCRHCSKWLNRKSLAKHQKTNACRGHSALQVVPADHRARSVVSDSTTGRQQRGGAAEPADGNERNISCEKRGQNFALSFSSRFKYKISQRLLTPRMEFSTEEVIGMVVSDEAGGGYMPNVHSHAYIKTKNPCNFEEFTNLWVIQLQCPGFTDVQSPKKIKDWVKYITKEDYRSVVCGVDKDLLGTICKSYSCAQKWSKIMPTLPPYCYLSWIDKKIFDGQFAVFHREHEEDKLLFNLQNAILFDWQIEVLRLLDEQDDRKVLWIYDAVGGEGKTFLAKYIQLYRDCICLESGKKTDLAHCFTNEKYVLFDYTRSMVETINYSIIENFKNGFLFSGKYDSQVKKFDPCKVCCFSNFSPDKSKLSEDRWMLYALDRGEMTLM